MGLGIGFLVNQGVRSTPEVMSETAGPGASPVVDSETLPLGEADFAGTGKRSRRWFDFKFPNRFFSIPEATSPSAGFVLPVVEKVHEQGERSF